MILDKRSGVFKAEWRQIKGYEGLYEVSNLGQVRSLDRIDNNKHFHKGIILKQKNHTKGYKYVGLCKNSKSKAFKIHRLVALAFIPNIENKPQTDHINTIKNNNRIWNLRWVTGTENANNPISKKHNSESKKR